MGLCSGGREFECIFITLYDTITTFDACEKKPHENMVGKGKKIDK